MSEQPADVDVIVVGAGFAGLYCTYRLRELGFTMRGFEAADDIGGTWYWNRYPGARVDIPSVDYMFSFDPDWSRDWQWSEKYATQPEILRYLRHTADKHDLRRDFRFSTRVRQASWDSDAGLWTVVTDRADTVVGRFLIMATGCLSMPKIPDIDGIERLGGQTYFTNRWPHEATDFTGKRVAVIGTGSSGIQSIPLIAAQAAQVVVFQRTPCFSIPAHNGPIAPDKLAQLADEPAYRQAARESPSGVPLERAMTPTFTVSAAERQARYQRAWELGELLEILNLFADTMTSRPANDDFADFVRDKIRATVDDPATAAALCPADYPIGAKRLCLDTGYFATYNRPNVVLVDLRRQPLTTVTETGIATTEQTFEFDAIVFATGFDAMTGALNAVDIVGCGGTTLRDTWIDGPSSYLGLSMVGFPNLFTITGPHSPSVLSNMAVSIEQHVDFVTDALDYLRAHDFDRIEATPLAQAGWMQHCADASSITLFPQADSWYAGANVPGKPRGFLAYTAGVDFYRAACDEVVAGDYLGFAMSGPGGSQCHDGVVRRLQPDVQMLLAESEAQDLPTLDSLPVDAARELYLAMVAAIPPGPEVGAVVDGSLPGAAGPLDYRLYRPATPGPHPIVVYFHGGGWVLGDVSSDDPLCRDLCVRTDAIVISVDYRHAPEHRFPAAIEDGLAAVRWIGEHATQLGGAAGQLAVAGWSAGGNIAAVVCRLVRDTGGPQILGQALLTPAVDTDMSRASHHDNGDDYRLTTSLLRWFHDHYAPGADPADPRLAPLRAEDLSGLPPAIVITAEFDPLRDEGELYAQALSAAGIPVRLIRARGHIHTSLTLVGLVASGEPIRAELADWLRTAVADVSRVGQNS